jgi:glycosyltransferase involved in cell wall biosynthesis
MQSQSQRLISIFLPTRARFHGGYLERAINSVLAQTHKTFELFIIDDASVDGTAGLVQSICAKDPRVRHIRNEHHIGLPAISVAKAYLQASADCFAFVFDDGEWFPDHLEKLGAAIDNSSRPQMVWGKTRVVQQHKTEDLGQPFDRELLKRINYLGNPSVMFNRAAVERAGFFDPHIVLKRVNDWDLWRRMAEKDVSMTFIPELVCVENGIMLADSLGNSVTINMDLSVRMVESNRDWRLSPQRVADYLEEADQPEDWMSNDDVRRLNELALEHYIRVNNHDKVLNYCRVVCETAGLASRETIESWSDSALLMNAVSHAQSSGILSQDSYFRKQYLQIAMQFGEASQKNLQVELELAAAKAELKQLKDEMQTLLSSSSWSITRPLREVKSLFHNR